MKLPTPPDAPQDLEGLVAACLELHEASGPGAVDGLLSRHPDSAVLVRRRLDALGRLGLIGETPLESLPERVGGYGIVRVLGRGGMGVVYEAEQEQPRRRVALKVLRAAPGARALDRFRHEAELLARLRHPDIATVYEAGTAVVGGLTVPFFAMELVRGRTLDRYVAEERPSVAEKVELVARIALAVHYAHQRGVVHRDLKPGNVLIDERGEPRVLDFGIARATDPDLRRSTLRTEAGQLVGTLAYMSPEQSTGDPDRVDSQADVYSLGVVAYELLAGRLPLEVAGRSVLDVLESIRDEAPVPLGRIDRALRGDLETIVAKALAKEKEQRYASAHELAADLRRYLRDEPIGARPATAGYQLRKFARRNRALVAGAAAVLLALVLGLVGTLAGLDRAAATRRDLERRLAVADAVRVFQSRMFARADPDERGLRVEELLDRSALLVDEWRESPLEGAAVRSVLGSAYSMTGALEKAEPLLVRSAELFERELGPRDLQTLRARMQLARFYLGGGRYGEAEAVLEDVVEAAVKQHGENHEIAHEARLCRAQLLGYLGRYAEQAELCTRALDRGVERGRWLDAKLQRAMARVALSEFDGAAADAREAHEWARDAWGEEHPETLTAQHTLGAVLQRAGRVEEGGRLIEEVFEKKRALLGPQHPETLLAMVEASYRYEVSGRLERAIELLGEASETASLVLPPDHPTRRAARGNLAGVLQSAGRSAEAEPLLRAQLESETRLVGREHPSAQSLIASLAMALQDTGRLEEAETLFVEAHETAARVSGERDVHTVFASFNLGEFYRRTDRVDEALPLLRVCSETAAEVLDATDFRVPWIQASWALALVSAGRRDEAETVLARARAFAEHLAAGDPTHGKLEHVQAELDRMRGE